MRLRLRLRLNLPRRSCLSSEFRASFQISLTGHCFYPEVTMRLEKCWFCSSTIYPVHGMQFVRNDAKIFRFCRSKCHKNFKMKRNPRKVKWTKAYRRLHGKDMTQDSTFEFERKRNRPERYNRNLIQETLKAIPKIVKVRADRQDKHIEKRMKGKKAKDLAENRKELDQGIFLVKAPNVLQKDPSLYRRSKSPDNKSQRKTLLWKIYQKWNGILIDVDPFKVKFMNILCLLYYDVCMSYSCC
ncbi:hypothetical protein V2J09_007905 [Rumex salicifolius]